jgi:hypothetical protein
MVRYNFSFCNSFEEILGKVQFVTHRKKSYTESIPQAVFFQRLTVVHMLVWQLLKRHPDDATVMVHMGQLEKKEGM